MSLIKNIIDRVRYPSGTDWAARIRAGEARLAELKAGAFDRHGKWLGDGEAPRCLCGKCPPEAARRENIQTLSILVERWRITLRDGEST